MNYLRLLGIKISSIVIKTKPFLSLVIATALQFTLPYAAHAESFTVNDKLKIETSEAQIRIRCSSPVSYQFELIDNPSRAVIDLKNFTISRPRSFELASHPIFNKLRVGRHLDFTRIVIDLGASPTTTPLVSTIDGSIVIDFSSREKKAGGNPTQQQANLDEPTEKPDATPKVLSITRIEPAPTIEATPTALPPTPTVATPLPTASSLPTIAATPETPAPSIESSISSDEGTIRNAELRFAISALVASIPATGRGVYDVAVKNKGDSTLFMTSSALEVTNPGRSPENLVSTSSLLASPRRFSLDPGQERNVRLLVGKRQDESKEGVFRVHFIPETQSFEEMQQAPALQVATGIAMLVFIEPKLPKAALKSTWKNNILTLENTGNINIMLERGRSCVGDKCSPIPTRRIYPGDSWQLKFRSVETVEFSQRIGNDFERLVLHRE
jgi:P pilus assembly chaperone PapD